MDLNSILASAGLGSVALILFICKHFYDEFKELKNKVNALDTAYEVLSERGRQQHDQLMERIENLCNRFDELNTRIEGLYEKRWNK